VSSPQPVADLLAALTRALGRLGVLAGRPSDLDDVAAITHAHRDDLDVEKIRGTLRLLEGALDRSDLLGAFERFLRP